MKQLALLAVVVAFATASAGAADIARFDTYGIRDKLLADGYPTVFGNYAEGKLACCVASAEVDVDGCELPSSPAWNQWSAVGFDDGGAFVFTVVAVGPGGGCPDGGYFAPAEFYIGGIKRSSSGPTTGSITADWVEMDGVTTGSKTIDTFDITSSYQNHLYDISDIPAVSKLTITFSASGASSASGTLRIGNYYDGSYHDFGITGQCVPEPGTMGLLVVAAGLLLRRRR